VQHLDIIRVFYLPTDAQENCFKKNIKIYIKTAPTCFDAIIIIIIIIIIIRERCGHTTELTTRRCILIDYFNNCNFQQDQIMRSLMMV
jgi:hypothetical protein